jgi:molecular chaperone HtpG
MAEKTFNFEADTGKILNIVINSLYSQSEIFLRELISNASDAINKRKFEVAGGGAAADTFDGAIDIAVDKKVRTVKISDNGIGLSADEMVSTLGTIASSGTRAFIDQAEQAQDKKAKANDDVTAQLIGQFGVGFYSAFMVADKIEVLSRRHGSDHANLWVSDGQSGFSISDAVRDDIGTDITLHLRKEAKEYLDQERIQHLVKKYSDYIAQPVSWMGAKGEREQLNSSTALWTKPAKDVSDEDYNSFYFSVAAAYDTPFATLHNRTEGTVEFTNLLFIPSVAPFDLFDPERRSHLHLYVNRVFITDNYEGLLPKWLRFMRGVIDTPDVDLNVSREMLQQNPTVQRINKALVKRVLGEFKKALDKRRDDYASLWNALGRVIKEGLYEDQANRDKILEIALFQSTKDDKLITLQDYIDNFANGQDVIYYLSAENADLARRSPHLEAFEARGIDVLLLTDPIDDFWLSQVSEFAGKSFQSITRGEIDISNVGTPKDDAADTAEPVLSAGFVGQIKLALGDDVADVRSSANLQTSLARLVADKDGMDPQMEQMMRMHNPDFKGVPKILEVNAKHPLIKSIDSKIDAGNFDGADHFAKLIFDSALVAEGKTIADPRAFTERLVSVMQRALSS